MKILITGHKGFIGQNIVNRLKNKHELVFFDWGDPAPDFEDLDWCIHLGAVTSTSETDVEKIMRQNYDFSCMLLIACQTNNVNLQYASSASVYGSNKNFKEDAPLLPQTPYAWSKYFFERVVKNTKFTNIVVQGFRYFNVYGPYEDHKINNASPFHTFTKQAKEHGIIKLFEGSKNYYRDFIHVDKVIDIHEKFFNVNESGIWNVGTGKSLSFKTIAEEIAENYHAEIEYIPMPEHLKHQYQTYTCADLTKLNKTINK